METELDTFMDTEINEVKIFSMRTPEGYRAKNLEIGLDILFREGHSGGYKELYKKWFSNRLDRDVKVYFSSSPDGVSVFVGSNDYNDARQLALEEDPNWFDRVGGLGVIDSKDVF